MMGPKFFLVAMAMALAVAGAANSQAIDHAGHAGGKGPVPGMCEAPATDNQGKVGCFHTASLPVGPLAGTVYWHLVEYPDLAAAERDRPSGGLVKRSFDRIWLQVIGPGDWSPRTGRRVSLLGPLTVKPGVDYTARFMEARFEAGMKTRVHVHSGDEAFYMLGGSQCLETPEGTKLSGAGEGLIIREGLAMQLSSQGAAQRQSIVLALHDSARPWMTMSDAWTPPGRCPP